MKKVNVGLIGYKFMGKAHSHAYMDLPKFFRPDAVPVRKAICGRAEDAVKEACHTWEYESYETSWEDLLRRDDIDLVDITTPNSTHRDIAVAAAEAGKDIFCEKPLALNVAQAEEMVKAVGKAGVKHMVNFNYRRVPAVGLAKRLIDEGKLGRIYHWRAQYLQDWAIDPRHPRVWRFEKGVAGSGALGDIGAHIVDLARLLVGEIEEVVGNNRTFIKRRPDLGGAKEKDELAVKSNGRMKEVTVDDTTLFLANFSNGVVGSFEATRFASGRKNREFFEINGSEGSLYFNFERMNELGFYSREDPEYSQGFRTILVTNKSHPYIKAWWPEGNSIGYEHTFVHQVYELMQAIAHDYQPKPSFEDGLECQRVLDAVSESIERRTWVKVRGQ